MLANPFWISHTLLHRAQLDAKSTGSAAGSADSASKDNCSSLCPSASFLPSLWKLVFSLVPEISLIPPYLKLPQDRSQLAIVTSNMHRPSTSQLQPSTWNPFSHAQRQFQNKASPTVHPLPSSQGTASSPAPFLLQNFSGLRSSSNNPRCGKGSSRPTGKVRKRLQRPSPQLSCVM